MAIDFMKETFACYINNILKFYEACKNEWYHSAQLLDSG